MPRFPHSGYSASPGSGVFVRAQGSHSPMVEADAPDSNLVHPFQVVAFKDGADVKVRVRAGTVNNITPEISGTTLDAVNPLLLTLSGDHTHRIYLRAESNNPPVFFPDGCHVISSISDLGDIDTYGYLKIASVVVSGGAIVSVNQFVYASQVVVRAKPGTATALWSWSSR